MSIPPLIRESEPTDAGWKRKTRDLLNAVTKRTMGQGLTMERPRNPDVGVMFYDTTLGKPIWWNGSAWRDAAGAAV